MFLRLSLQKLCQPRGLFAVELSLKFLDVGVAYVVFVVHQFVDVAVWCELYDAIGHGVDKLMVVRSKENVAFEELEVVVEGLDAFHVEVVCRRVEYQAVGILELHTGYHAAHLFASAQDVYLFQHVFVFEEHTPEECFEIDFVACTELRQPVEHVQVAVEELGVVEREVSRRDGDAPLEGAFLRFAIAVDDFKERGHGAWVAAEEHHLFAFLYVEREVLEEHGAVVGCSAQAFHFQYLIAWLALHAEDDAWIAACAGLDFSYIELLEHFLSAGGLAALSHVGREAADELFQLFLLLFGLHLLVLCLAQGELRTFVPEAVVAGKERHLAKVDVHRVGTNLVEKVAVVAHHEHRVLKVAKIVFEPFHCFEVEVVGRLVEQEVVGVAKECLRQHHAYFLFTAQLAHEFLVKVFLDAQSREQFGCVALSLVAAQVGKLLGELGYEHTVFVAEVGLAVERVQLVLEVPEHRVSHQYGVEHGVFVKLEVVLREHTEALARSHFDGALRGLQFAADGFEQGRFPRAVCADDAIDVAVGELHVHVFVEHAFAKLNG